MDLQEKLSELVILTASRTLMGATSSHMALHVAMHHLQVIHTIAKRAKGMVLRERMSPSQCLPPAL